MPTAPLLRTMHASLVLDEGADLVICINPLVAYDASAGGRRRPDGALTQRGLSVVLGQTFRSLIQSRMQVGMAGYHSRYPASDILLFEPDRDDERMFFANVFRYADRPASWTTPISACGPTCAGHADTLDRALGRHGLRLRREVLRDPHRSFHASIEQQRLANARVTRDLDRTLRRLEQAGRRRRLTARWTWTGTRRDGGSTRSFTVTRNPSRPPGATRNSRRGSGRWLTTSRNASPPPTPTCDGSRDTAPPSSSSLPTSTGPRICGSGTSRCCGPSTG